MTRLKEFAESTANAVLERVGRGFSKLQERKPLPYDLLESDEAFLVVFDAPGASKSDVQVRFVDDEVQVRIDRFREFHEGFEMRAPGRGLSLDGRVRLPDGAAVDPGEAAATLTRNGTLQVRIPKERTGQDVAVTEEISLDDGPAGADEEHAEGAESAADDAGEHEGDEHEAGGDDGGEHAAEDESGA